MYYLCVYAFVFREITPVFHFFLAEWTRECFTVCVNLFYGVGLLWNFVGLIWNFISQHDEKNTHDGWSLYTFHGLPQLALTIDVTLKLQRV